MAEKTYADVVRAFPEAGELIAAIQEQNGRDIVNALPTWDMVEKARRDGYEQGYADGVRLTRQDLFERIFGAEEVWD